MYGSLNLVHDILNVSHCKCRFRNVSPTCCLRLDEMGKAACEIRIVEIGDMYSFIFKVNCVRRFDTFQHQCIVVFCHFDSEMLCCCLTVVFIHTCCTTLIKVDNYDLRKEYTARPITWHSILPCKVIFNHVIQKRGIPSLMHKHNLIFSKIGRSDNQKCNILRFP